jgi:hypothetical protein
MIIHSVEDSENVFEERNAIPIRVLFSKGGPTGEPTYYLMQDDKMMIISQSMLKAIVEKSVMEESYSEDHG